MFNLFRSRAKAVRYLLGGLLTLVALSMVTYLIPGYGSSTRSSNEDSVLADIGGDKLTVQEVQQVIDRITRSGQMPREMLEVYLPQMVDEEVRRRATIYEAERLGLTVSDDEVLTGLMSEFPQFFQNGTLVSKEQFELTLAQQGMTTQQVIDEMRRQLLLRKLQNVALQGLVVTPKEVDDELVRKNEKAKIQYIAFPPAKFRDQIKPDPQEMQKIFEANRAQYTIPEKRSFDVVVVDQAKVEQSLVVSDAQLRAAYSASMDNFRMPERIKVRHILIKTMGKPDSEKKQLQAKAEDVLKQLKNGGDFAALAKKYSDDTVSAQKGGDLDWIVRGQTVPEFEKVAFSLKPNEMSGVVTTEFGYHIIQVTDKEPARVKPFEEVKAGLADQMKKQQVGEKMQSLGDQIHEALQKAPGSAAQVAKQFDAELVTVPKASAGEAIPTLGVAPEIDNALAAMKKGDVSPVLVLPANRLAVVVLNDRTPARPAEFSEVESQVRERVISDKSQVIAGDRAKEAADKLKAGADMEKVAKSMKLEVTTPAEFGHSDSVEGLGPAGLIEDAFTKPVGTIFGPVMVQGRNVVCKVIDKKSVDLANLAQERESVLQSIKSKKARAVNDLLMDSVLTRLTSEGKVKIHRDTVKRLAASFRQR